MRGLAPPQSESCRDGDQAKSLDEETPESPTRRTPTVGRTLLWAPALLRRVQRLQLAPGRGPVPGETPRSRPLPHPRWLFGRRRHFGPVGPGSLSMPVLAPGPRRAGLR